MKSGANRKAIATAALALGLVIGGAGISAAATGHLPTGGGSDEGSDQPYTSSVTAAKGASLNGLAKIQADQAVNTAASIGGTPGTALLENDEGNVVYTVVVTKPSGEKVEVAIDAGNGALLNQEPTDGETNDDASE